MTMIALRSSAIAAAGFDGSTLRIEFTSSGQTYDYPDVPVAIFHGLLDASSAGAYYARYIRDQYGTRRFLSLP